MSEIRFYLDENLNPAIADQLKRDGIDVITTHDLDMLGDKDMNHLQRATAVGRVLCTRDPDFLRLHNEGVEHAGIAFGQHHYATIGGWVKALRALHSGTTAEDMRGQLRYLQVR